ncbi:MAG: nitrous oxide reductase accessory protein NosL [Solibacillus sp.]
MKKIIAILPLAALLYACGDQQAEPVEPATPATEVVEKDAKPVYVATAAEWEIDERLSEPTADTVCEMCNMKVYMKNEEMGVFSAQAVKPDGSTAFYDDIGCLLNAELAQNQVNEKFVRDYVTLNWINVEEATLVKTQLKSPMNWGYIFFKFEEDAQTYIEENPGAVIEELDVVKQAAKERREKKLAEQAKHNDQNGDMHGDAHDEEGHTH